VVFAAVSHLTRGAMRPARAQEFSAEIEVAWLPSVASDEEDLSAPPSPTSEREFTLPPPLPEAPPLVDDFAPLLADDPLPDPSFADLPRQEEPVQELKPPSQWLEPKLASGRLPPRPRATPPATPNGPATTDPRGNVVAAAAHAHGNAAPDYPLAARRRGQEGVVTLRVHVAADGTCGAVEVEISCGHAALDEAAVTAVRKWKFDPALADGVAVASELLVPIRFVLKAETVR
jgi:protein TonB